jgi:CRISPR system Cascade subunit CasA
MNVAFDEWIPVVTLNGERRLVSLLEIFTQGNSCADLAVRPHERVSLMRLFLCVAHAALKGPEDFDQWLEAIESLPEKAELYLQNWKECFELYHKNKPWLQVAGLSKSVDGQNDSAKDWTSVSKLNFSFATGNNTTLFDHQGMNPEDRVISINATVISMLAFQCFSTGGLISQVYWNGTKTVKTAKDAPCVSASMVHSFLRGKNLLKTIHLNLPTYESIQLNNNEQEIGVPIWEKPPVSLNDTAGIKNATRTFLGRLVPMARLIRLHPNGKRMLLGDGLVYPTFADGFPPEPSATVIIRKKDQKEERALLSFRPDKAIWRELGAIVVKRKAEGNGGPLFLQAINDGADIDLLVAALARNQATIIDTVESVFHIPSKLRSPEGTSTYETEVNYAETLAKRLGWAIEKYRKSVDGGWEGRLKGAGPRKGALKARLFSTATIHYWTAVEKNLEYLWAHIKVVGTEAAVPTRQSWRKVLFSAACDAYRTACGQETPRQIRGFVEGWNQLAGKKGTNETLEMEGEA